MPTNAGSQGADANKRRIGTYIYGIVPGDVELVPDVHGIGDQAGEITLVRHGPLAALVSEIDIDRPIGRPEDLKIHEQLLDATAAADVPVLPMRFGAVMASPEAVKKDLLTPNQDLFADTLEELDGRAEYVVNGRFVENAILKRVLSDNPAVAKQRERVRDADAAATQDERIQLGQMVNSAIEESRDQETAKLIDAVADFTLADAVRSPSSELDAFNVAFLVELNRATEFGQAVEKFATDADGLVKARLRGPLAAYDFIVAKKPGED